MQIFFCHSFAKIIQRVLLFCFRQASRQKCYWTWLGRWGVSVADRVPSNEGRAYCRWTDLKGSSCLPPRCPWTAKTISGRARASTVDRWERFGEFVHIHRIIHKYMTNRRHLNEWEVKAGSFSSLQSLYQDMRGVAHLVSAASLDDLNANLRAAGSGTTASVDNFRPNIVVSGCEAYAEDEWDFIKIGTAVFRNARPCTRFGLREWIEVISLPSLESIFNVLTSQVCLHNGWSSERREKRRPRTSGHLEEVSQIRVLFVSKSLKFIPGRFCSSDSERMLTRPWISCSSTRRNLDRCWLSARLGNSLLETRFTSVNSRKPYKHSVRTEPRS